MAFEDRLIAENRAGAPVSRPTLLSEHADHFSERAPLTFSDVDYPVESAIAEKLQTMVALGDANSRMKDFYDVWICSKHLDFDTGALLRAIDATFKNRKTLLPAAEFEALTTNFIEGHRVQWNAFVKKMGEGELTDAFGKVIEDLRIFVIPMLRWLARDEKLTGKWKAGSGWVAS